MRSTVFYSKTTKSNKVIVYEKETCMPGTGWDKEMKHPITITYDSKLRQTFDDATFDMLPEEVQGVFRMWCWMTFEERKTPNPDQTSCGLKDVFEHTFGVYLTNNQFKDGMLQCGYTPSCTTEAYWRFRIKTVKDKGVCPENCRYIYNLLRDVYRKE